MYHELDKKILGLRGLLLKVVITMDVYIYKYAYIHIYVHVVIIIIICILYYSSNGTFARK